MTTVQASPESVSPADPWEVAFDAIPFPIYVADCASYDIICVNHAMRRRSGGTVGEKCHKAIYRRDAPCEFCRMDELRRMGGQARNLLVFEHFDDARDCWYQLQESLMYWNDGRIAKYSVAVDISGVKEVQNALAEAHAQLALTNRDLAGALEGQREAMRHQRNLLAMVSHEFRMPLAIIEGAAQLLEIYNRTQDDALDEVGKVRRAVRRLTDLIDVCLAEERLDTSLPTLKTSVFDLADLAASVCATGRRMVGESRVTLTVRGSGDVAADQGLLGLALSNLIDNALKYTQQHTVVEVVVDSHGDGLTFQVLDRGPGVPEAERERIFEKFYRSSSTGAIGGAGLGLSIVKRIIELHGGTVAVDDRPGGGALFTIRLQRHQT